MMQRSSLIEAPSGNHPAAMDGFDGVLAAARAGAEWAWERIYGELAPGVAGYLRAHGAAEPDDVTGEVFLQVVRGLDGFEGGEAAFRAWVFTITHRRHVDHVRRGVRRPVRPAPDDVLERAAGPGGDVEDDAAARLEEAAVREAIASLPPDQRSVLLLRILGDLTIEEIARAVGKRPGAVKALQRRAVRRMEGAYPFEALERLP
jgi:RNA polymerase sigma-70 factor (ECF subfamily)